MFCKTSCWCSPLPSSHSLLLPAFCSSLLPSDPQTYLHRLNNRVAWINYTTHNPPFLVAPFFSVSFAPEKDAYLAWQTYLYLQTTYCVLVLKLDWNLKFYHGCIFFLLLLFFSLCRFIILLFVLLLVWGAKIALWEILFLFLRHVHFCSVMFL